MYFNNFLCVNYKKIIALEGILVSFPNGTGNFFLSSYTFCLQFILVLLVWIRIRILNTDPDLKSCRTRIRIGSPNTDPNWIAEHGSEVDPDRC